ncbi:hypothetical protein [Jiangella aurantiaca]|nr:hypothetical protein [Jiangella aurantiaca]
MELTKQKMSAEFEDEPHSVLTIRDGDLDPATDGELIGPSSLTAYVRPER